MYNEHVSMDLETQFMGVLMKTVCHGQDRQAMEASAERRGEAFELMRSSRFLHKSGMNKLSAQQDQTPACKEGLAKIDDNMVRCAPSHCNSHCGIPC